MTSPKCPPYEMVRRWFPRSQLSSRFEGVMGLIFLFYLRRHSNRLLAHLGIGCAGHDTGLSAVHHDPSHRLSVSGLHLPTPSEHPHRATAHSFHKDSSTHLLRVDCFSTLSHRWLPSSQLCVPQTVAAFFCLSLVFLVFFLLGLMMVISLRQLVNVSSSSSLFELTSLFQCSPTEHPTKGL